MLVVFLLLIGFAKRKSNSNMRIPLLILVLTVAVIADEDYYKLLGIERDADDRTIRKAFKKLAIQKHPDKNKT
ncbi:DnaJ domain protein [Ancylostoma duodenale]|uniref:DnaJ domain protein n=1 Tax=Ancylostoma duodenale TaxID=51022 RepID=A0A0C2DCR6_9BILA|nr:DnaJ domain protein [Ancylostoma duodenale]